jgi:hypothetical protein
LISGGGGLKFSIFFDPRRRLLKPQIIGGDGSKISSFFRLSAVAARKRFVLRGDD